MKLFAALADKVNIGSWVQTMLLSLTFLTYLDSWMKLAVNASILNRDFNGLIRSAASTASRIQGDNIQGGPWTMGAGRTTDQIRTTERGAPLELPSLDFAFEEAALAADLITA